LGRFFPGAAHYPPGVDHAVVRRFAARRVRLLFLGFAPYGAGDVGEVELLASQTKPGDDGSFFEAFAGYARRRIEEGDLAAARVHRATARDCYLRAASFLGVAYHPIYGTPVDPRLVDAFHLQMETFDKFAMLGDPPAERVQVRYEGTTLPVRCPTLITSAESDPASSNARELYEALRCPKGFLSFLDADGAGMHCEMQNRSMANRQILDWLDDTLQAVD
jgi:hypothetical protein